ncbi:MAG: hypothetical protein WD024_08535 [Bacillota bacterium]
MKRYLTQTKTTDPGAMAREYEGLPSDIAGLVGVVQNVFLHIHWAARYGVTPTDEQEQHVQARLVSGSASTGTVSAGSRLTPR